MARNIYGLDLGTYEIKIFDKKKVRIWREKNVIAMKDKKYIFSVGNEAYKMYEKAPENVEILFPMKNGVIARFDDMQYLLGSLLKTDHQFARGAEYVIAVPTDVTEVEKKAFYDLVMHSEAKAKSVRIVERGLADAVGLGLDVMNETGIFIANFGGGTTELSVLSRGGQGLGEARHAFEEDVAVGEQGHQKGFHKMTLSHDGLVHAVGYKADEIALACNEFVEFANIDAFAHNLCY